MKKNQIKFRIGSSNKEEQIFKAIISHPMETGYRKSHRTGKIIPADYIEDLWVRVDGATVFEIVFGENVSKNPFLTFTFSKPLRDNQNLQIGWMDNHKDEVNYDFVLNITERGTFTATASKRDSEVYQFTPDPLPTCKNKSTSH